MNAKLLAAYQRSDKTAYQIAQATGISNSTLSRWAQGRQSLGLDLAERIAQAIGYKLELRKTNRRWA